MSVVIWRYQMNEKKQLDVITNLKEAGNDVELSTKIKEKFLEAQVDEKQKEFNTHLKINHPIVEKNHDLLINEGVEKGLIEPEVVDKVSDLKNTETVDQLLEKIVPFSFVRNALSILFVGSEIVVAIIASVTVAEFSWWTLHGLVLLPFIAAVIYIEDWPPILYKWYTSKMNRVVTKTVVDTYSQKLLNQSFTKLKLENQTLLPGQDEELTIES